MQTTLPLDLGDGLIMRHATSEDADALSAFNASIFRDPETQVHSEEIRYWVRDLLANPHPSFQPGDFTIVEDTREGKIVSSMNLIEQVWSYGRIPFKVGRPEVVGTLPEYQRRGLVRKQFEIVHAWGVERGHKMQAITGIPFYYRQFSYDYALPLDFARTGYLPHIPKLKDGETEPYQFRKPTEADLPFMMHVYQHTLSRYPVGCLWDEAYWRYEALDGRHEKSATYREWQIIQTPDGEPVGLLAYSPRLYHEAVYASFYELKAGVSWSAVTPSVTRYLADLGRRFAERDKKNFSAFGFNLGAEHPIYQIMPEQLPRIYGPYAWYVRIPDLPDFLSHIKPVLEDRLAHSGMDGFSGETKINFYRTGLRLVFETGHLTCVEPWNPPHPVVGNIAFPNLTFLQLVMGYHSFDELHSAYPDCWGDSISKALLDALFPKKWSTVWPVS